MGRCVPSSKLLVWGSLPGLSSYGRGAGRAPLDRQRLLGPKQSQYDFRRDGRYRLDLPGHFVIPEAHASPGLARDGTEASSLFNQDATLREGKGGHVEQRRR